MTTAFDPLTAGSLNLRNRIVMAPMTRSRANGTLPTDDTATYYTQRAAAGLIITEGTQPSAIGQGYPFTPGLHTAEEVAAWRPVVQGVHSAGGTIVAQLMHTGRIGHPSNTEAAGRGPLTPVGPSAVKAAGQIFTPTGPQEHVQPRALTEQQIGDTITDFAAAAHNAIDAGFDGVEIHGATGYILDEFLRDGANHRDDEYGGSIENRARLLLEVADAAIEVWGADRVGVKVSPTQLFNSMSDSDPAATFGYLAAKLSDRGIAYLHVVEPDAEEGIPEEWTAITAGSFRDRFAGALVGGGGYDRDRAEAAVAAGELDVVAFGQLFLANPDLPARFAEGAELNVADPETFYGGDDAGYTDYPALTAS